MKAWLRGRTGTGEPPFVYELGDYGTVAYLGGSGLALGPVREVVAAEVCSVLRDNRVLFGLGPWDCLEHEEITTLGPGRYRMRLRQRVLDIPVEGGLVDVEIHDGAIIELSSTLVPGIVGHPLVSSWRILLDEKIASRPIESAELRWAGRPEHGATLTVVARASGHELLPQPSRAGEIALDAFDQWLHLGKGRLHDRRIGGPGAFVVGELAKCVGAACQRHVGRRELVAPDDVPAEQPGDGRVTPRFYPLED